MSYSDISFASRAAEMVPGPHDESAGRWQRLEGGLATKWRASTHDGSHLHSHFVTSFDVFVERHNGSQVRHERVGPRVRAHGAERIERERRKAWRHVPAVRHSLRWHFDLHDD